jgi:hypothetical protein
LDVHPILHGRPTGSSRRVVGRPSAAPWTSNQLSLRDPTGSLKSVDGCPYILHGRPANFPKMVIGCPFTHPQPSRSPRRMVGRPSTLHRRPSGSLRMIIGCPSTTHGHPTGSPRRIVGHPSTHPDIQLALLGEKWTSIWRS